MAGSYRHANNTVSAHDALAVTPSDSTVLPITRALYVGTGGTVVVVMAEAATASTTSTFTNVANGSVLPVQVSKVYSTGTTASSILALY